MFRLKTAPHPSNIAVGIDLPLLGGPPFKLEFGGYGPPCWVYRNEV